MTRHLIIKQGKLSPSMFRFKFYLLAEGHEVVEVDIKDLPDASSRNMEWVWADENQ